MSSKTIPTSYISSNMNFVPELVTDNTIMLIFLLSPFMKMEKNFRIEYPTKVLLCTSLEYIIGLPTCGKGYSFFYLPRPWKSRFDSSVLRLVALNVNEPRGIWIIRRLCSTCSFQKITTWTLARHGPCFVRSCWFALESVKTRVEFEFGSCKHFIVRIDF